MTFEELRLDGRLLRALEREGFETPTPIQRGAIPPALEGLDILGVAQTGTGKTAAFVLPGLDRLLSAPERRQPHRPRMVVLAPTRELALQITEHARLLGRYTGLEIGAIYGGAPLGKQADQLLRGLDIVVATPGRLLDHLHRRNLRFDDLRILVLDEADRMLDMGFLPDIEEIIRRMPATRQTMLFSATMPGPIQGLTLRFMRNPARVEIGNSRPPEMLRQELYPVPKHLKISLLMGLLQTRSVESTLVFTRTKQDADVVARKLREAGFSIDVMHGDFAQKDRVRALQRFRDGQARILVATNIAARGLDIEGVSHVVNFDVPDEAEDYVHRIGRTARVDAHGVAWTLVTEEDEGQVAAIEYLLGEKIERLELEGFDYAVPPPDWAKPSPETVRRSLTSGRGTIARWKSLTR
ncbi:MAG TPA: DEAD/DEAH box helicase [Anaerolineales bacterium]|nr:DEAD/DEAH box helicase [Anaerolineales bacterium]